MSKIHNILKHAPFAKKIKVMNHKDTNPKLKKLIRKSLFTPKQEEVLELSKKKDLRILIHHGGVGSGKTKINNHLFIIHVIEVIKEAIRTRGPDVEPLVILAGYTQENIVNNIINPLVEDYGLNIKFDRNGNFKLFGVKVVTTFLNNPRGEASIRGLNAWFIYVNEATTANRSAFDELRKRMRGGKRPIMILDTNPDHPLHWLKTDYIDKSYTLGEERDLKAEEEGRKTKGVYSVHSTPLDNPFLEQAYIDDLNNQPEGASKQRSLGYWTTGSGAVYNHFDPEFHYISKDDLPDKSQFTEYFVGVDWGWRDPTVFLLFGRENVTVEEWDEDEERNIRRTEERTYLLEEAYKVETHMEYWQEVAKRWMSEYGRYLPFYCDTEDPGKINKLLEIGANALNANKNIDLGVEAVSKVIEEGRLFVVEEEVWHFKEEINTYEWNEKNGKPIKKDDHVMDALRYAIYTHKEAGRQGFGFY